MTPVSRPDPRNPLSAGMMWASRVMTIALGFVVPALLGFSLDQWLGSRPIGILVGMVLGFAAGMLQLLRIAKGDPRGERNE